MHAVDCFDKLLSLCAPEEIKKNRVYLAISDDDANVVLHARGDGGSHGLVNQGGKRGGAAQSNIGDYLTVPPHHLLQAVRRLIVLEKGENARVMGACCTAADPVSHA